MRWAPWSASHCRRQIVQGDREIRLGLGIDGKKTITRAMRGQKTGVVGLGAIGHDFAKRSELIGMETRWWGPRPKDAPWLGKRYGTPSSTLRNGADNLVIAAKVDASQRQP